MNEKNKLCDFHTDTSPQYKPSYSLLDPNPSLIDINGNLINNINLAQASQHVVRELWLMEFQN